MSELLELTETKTQSRRQLPKTTNAQRLSTALLDPTRTLTTDEWASLYARLWDAHEMVLAQNEQLKFALLSYAGKAAGFA
jgi:hypothetical protein